MLYGVVNVRVLPCYDKTKAIAILPMEMAGLRGLTDVWGDNRKAARYPDNEFDGDEIIACAPKRRSCRVCGGASAKKKNGIIRQKATTRTVTGWARQAGSGGRKRAISAIPTYSILNTPFGGWGLDAV